MTSVHSFDEVTGWSFDADVQQAAVPGGEAQQLPTSGGLVLRNITHRANNFARSLRLVGIRLDVKEFAPTGAMVGQKNLLVTLDSTDFTLGPIQALVPREVAAPAVQGAPGTYLERLRAAAEEMRLLKSYFKDDEGNYSGFGLRADYVSKEGLLAGLSNCDISGLKISQIFLFSKYGNDPPHEPSKSLLAARCHPMTTFSMTPNPAVDRSRTFQRIESIRFDYRLHLAIDSVPAPGTQSAPQPRSNQAGLFQDSDSVSFIQAGLSSAVHWSIHRAVTRQAFDSVEKQLILEVIGPGTNHGMSKFYDAGSDLRECWDNLHWWGTRGGGSMISAPGAFHAAHMHWRWGGGAEPKVFSGVPEVVTSGRPKAAEGLRHDAGGPPDLDPDDQRGGHRRRPHARPRPARRHSGKALPGALGDHLRKATPSARHQRWRQHRLLVLLGGAPRRHRNRADHRLPGLWPKKVGHAPADLREQTRRDRDAARHLLRPRGRDGLAGNRHHPRRALAAGRSGNPLLRQLAQVLLSAAAVSDPRFTGCAQSRRSAATASG